MARRAPVKIVALLNEKGGVGKTTSAATLAHAFARRGRAVLAVDLDPQANLTAWLGNISPRATIANALTDYRSTNDAIGSSTATGVALLYGSREAADAADELRSSSPAPATALRRALRATDGRYDYVLLDCPPGVGVLSVNALVAASEIMVPVDSQAMALSGLAQLLKTLDELADAEILSQRPQINVFITRYDGRLALAREVRDYLASLEVAGLFEATIRVSTRLAECFGHQKTIYDYAPNEPVAADYERLAEEIDR